MKCIILRIMSHAKMSKAWWLWKYKQNSTCFEILVNRKKTFKAPIVLIVTVQAYWLKQISSASSCMNICFSRCLRTASQVIHSASVFSSGIVRICWCSCNLTIDLMSAICHGFVVQNYLGLIVEGGYSI